MKAIFSTTSTFTSTNTITEFSTASTTVTSTSSTTTTVTTNVPAPPGFVGIEESSGDIDATPVKPRRALSRGAVSRRVSHTDVYDATSPYQCCVACLLNPAGCYASGFFINFDTPCVNFERRDEIPRRAKTPDLWPGGTTATSILTRSTERRIPMGRVGWRRRVLILDDAVMG
ncbi:MAG: hypothetical protein LQ349_004563 [Xanthoria aureola]|nr:MAG: hypothetical protein LQ349_004563 [Xanthoria aureola]